MDLQDYKHKISKEEINTYPMVQYQGDIRLVRDNKDLHAMLKDLEGEDLLGFDTETKPSFRKGSQNDTALIQLASADCVYLIQLLWLPMNKDLADILSNANIIKAGVAIHDDMRQLQKLYPFDFAGVVDLGDVARANNLETLGLRNLAANLFSWRISKGCQCSNWSLSQLSKKQMTYAATDAWIGRLLYLRMQDLGMV